MKIEINEWPDDYHDLTIGLNRGFILPNALVAEKKFKIKFQESDGTRSNIRKLCLTLVDGYVNDPIAVNWVIDEISKTGKCSAKLSLAGKAISKEEGFLGYTNTDNGKFKRHAGFKSQVQLDSNWSILNISL